MNAISRYLIILGGALLLCQGAEAHKHADSAASPAQTAAEQPFLQDNDRAMNTMMANMAISPSGNVDEDFVAMMTPHHQGAIDMAVAQLRYGKNPQLKRIAQEIIVTQQQEITAMYQALGKPLPPALPAPDQISPAR
ncbi:DUF305 domain-containing protein [Sodalis ligni]|jgi:uncharacterized protein (DUF305 family)|uniref:DUF305 family protein family protein n=1 Tax=Sodalis ligni TaxID=2697027 RepID=A0A4R1NFT2_9GAMM|nr:DUF305 domain-containing protein [Sodalis ligni]QWA10773.1 DUF305 domain-containing protein [Sodalis ligni]TCL05837.1 DUF305 family protein family protein [Sodalis ligni]